MVNEPPAPAPSPARPGLFRNWISLAGTVLAFSAFFAFVLLFAVDLLAHHGNPYMGILAYVVAPGFLLLGLGLVAFGFWLQRRRLRRLAPGQEAPHLTIDLGRPADQRRLLAFTLGSAAFLMLTAFGSFQTYHFSESVLFCGQVCHTPMKPEFTTHQISPHARVDCVRCHVGSGATGYLKAKLNGVHQLVGVLTDRYQRPVPPPAHPVPASETCENCHWSDRHVGWKEKTFHHFLADETNTAFTVILNLHVGGAGVRGQPAGGIHWHMNVASRVEYVTAGPGRENIPWVRLTDAAGQVTEFRSPDFKDPVNPAAIRRMDCTDCHNRPAHQFPSANASVDLALSAGRISPRIPWVKSNLVEVLTAPYATEPEALARIGDQLRARYAGRPDLESLVSEAHRIFSQGFFPEMKSDWRAYPDHLSHKDSAGCFRCHDGRHKTADGRRTLGASDCNSCHRIVAQGAGEELKKFNPDGHGFFHLDGEYSDFDCHHCHTGAFPK